MAVLTSATLLAGGALFSLAAAPPDSGLPPAAIKPATPAQLFPLAEVRLLPSPFAAAAAANRKYLEGSVR